ncbi:serine hydrolase domain-containing protein [Protaetiibacter larvae]|uniref:serine hydrolase domain-containing protein n=1 Tax=Protaetiibacter larvae TaxID=2592654 RepID=UPI00143D43A8|nr:serine hydrolase [Protaetiibacter larvae]
MSHPLPRSAPEAQGVSRDAVRSLFARLDAELDSLHGLVLVRHGHVVAEANWEPYAVDAAHALYSVSKSFTSTAIGFAVAEGLLGVDDRLVELFPDAAPADPSPRLAELRVRHLLTMSTGHAEDTFDAVAAGIASEDSSGVAAFLALPLEHDPGARFVYNTGASYVLSALVQRLSGERLLDYLTPRLLEPLGIVGAGWQQDRHGIDFGGFGLSITTRDIAAFGEFLLRRGRAGGRQLLPAEWIDTASAAHVANASDWPDWRQGYGYQFWRSRHGFRGDGAFGQFCLVLPEHDAVIAITASLRELQEPLEILWGALDGLFPASPPERSPEPSRADGTQGAPELAHFEVPAPTGARTSPRLASLAWARYQLEPSSGFDTLEIEPHREGTTLVFEAEDGVQRIHFGATRWIPGTSTRPAEPATPIRARGAWVSDAVFRGRVVAADDPHGVDHELRLDGDDVVWTRTPLVSFGPITTRTSRGRRA